MHDSDGLAIPPYPAPQDNGGAGGVIRLYFNNGY